MTDTKKLLLAGVVVLVLIIGLFVASRTGQIPMIGSRQMAPQGNTSTPTPIDSEEKNEVVIENYSYSPTNLIIKAGDTVTWKNNDADAHTATADDGSFDTGLLNQGESATITFDTPGTYSYHCTPHPEMKGTIVVE